MDYRELRNIITYDILALLSDGCNTLIRPSEILPIICAPICTSSVTVEVNETGDFADMVKSLRSFLKASNSEKRYQSYDRETIIEKITTEWICGKNLQIETIEKYVLSIKLFSGIDNDGYCIIKPLLYDKYSATPRPKSITIKYGVTKSKSGSRKIIHKTPFEEIRECDRALNEFWEKMFPNGFDIEHPFVWRYHIKKEDYEELKSLLLTCSAENHDNIVHNHALKLVVLQAEWFKREKPGKDDKNKGRATILHQLGLDNAGAAIWKSSKISNDYLVNNGRNEYAYSMQSLGGFPIWSLSWGFHPKDEEGWSYHKVLRYIETISCFENVDFQKVYNIAVADDGMDTRKASAFLLPTWQEYIKDIMSHAKMFDDSDLEIPEFKHFANNWLTTNK